VNAEEFARGAAKPSYLELWDKDPFPFYQDMLAAGHGVYWDEGMNAWMVLDHADANRVHRDEDVFAHPYNDLPGAVEVQGGSRQVIMLHGEEHTKLHRFLMRYLSPRVVEQYRRDFIAPLVSRSLDRVQADGQADLDAALAESLPAYVICTLLGVSMDDEELLGRCKAWNDDVMRWSETFGEDATILAEALASARNLASVLMPIIKDRRLNPQDDFLSALWREGPSLLDGWDEFDVLAQARVLLFAGSETTAHLLRNAIYYLIEHPDVRLRLIDRPEEIETFIEEILRYFGVIHFRIRSAAQDTELSGCPIHKGDRVHAVLSAADRDPAHYPNPEQFDMSRLNPRDHLAFGAGPRVCIGMNLARAETVEAIRQVLTRLPNLRWRPAGRPAEMHGHMPRSYLPLDACWDMP
jgi:cytochrome P450